jgi:hypothetical protein
MITIDVDPDGFPWIKIERDMPLNWDEATEFARSDGFRDPKELTDWHDAAHGLPFEGVLIEW